ncbi:MAG: cytochrome c maturation protein CcmE [Deltaproteobacteria bacterium]|nr:cytochrome c maturation protein CcmE [Deltaproteobacteria bacterium]
MSRKLIKIVASVVVVGGGLGALVYQSLGDNLEYDKQVDEVMVDPGAWQGKRLKLGGHVTKGSIFNKQGTLDYLFTVEKNGKSLQVHYAGIVPDTFKDDAEVVVAGKLTEKGTFEAHEVVAKCPSKYEAADKSGLTHPDGAEEATTDS